MLECRKCSSNHNSSIAQLTCPWDLKDTAFWRLASLLVPHHVTEGSEASCIVQMRINTEELHAEQDKRR